MYTIHYATERRVREELINKIGKGHIVASFIVDKGHKNGPEIHKITSTGIIIIYNERTGRLVTKLIARGGQIKRYYVGTEIPTEIYKVIKIAYIHEHKGYHLI